MYRMTLSVARMMITDVTDETAPRHILMKIEEENNRLLDALDAALKGSTRAIHYVLFEGGVKVYDGASTNPIVTHIDATATIRRLLLEFRPTVVTR